MEGSAVLFTLERSGLGPASVETWCVIAAGVVTCGRYGDEVENSEKLGSIGNALVERWTSALIAPFLVREHGMMLRLPGLLAKRRSAGLW